MIKNQNNNPLLFEFLPFIFYFYLSFFILSLFFFSLFILYLFFIYFFTVNKKHKKTTFDTMYHESKMVPCIKSF